MPGLVSSTSTADGLIQPFAAENSVGRAVNHPSRHFDWVVALGLAGLTIALRWPFRAALLTHWDAVQYALGLYDFNLSKHTPHPPGFPFYILLGRAATAVVGDPADAFVAISILTSAAALACGYWYTRLAFGRPAGLAMAVVLMTQPVLWYYGAAGNSWTNLALLSLLVGTLCLGLHRGDRRLVWPSAAVLGLASGFRLDVTVFMSPLWFWTLRQAEPSARRRVAAVALAVGCVGAWAVPVIVSAGGLEAWLANYSAMFVPVTNRSDASVAWTQQTGLLWGGAVLAVGPLLGLALLGAPRRALQFDWRGYGDMLVFTAIWVVPSFLFLWLTDTTEAGHNLLFICGLLPLVAGFAARRVSRGVMVLGCAGIVALQSAVFLLATPRAQPPFAFTANSMLLGFTAPALREQQATLRNTVAVVRANFDPKEVVIMTLAGQDVYRFAMYYLPEFTVVRTPDAGHGALRARYWQPLPPSEPTCGDGRVHAAWIVLDTTSQEHHAEADVEVPLPPESAGARWRVWSGAPCTESAQPLPEG